MTERLTRLLDDEAASVDVPAPDLASITSAGRRQRRRRRVTTLLSAAAAVALIGGGTWAITQQLSDGGDGGSPDPATPPTSLAATGAYAIRSTLYLGGTTVELDEEVRRLSYVRHGIVATTRTGRLWFVGVDGVRRDLDLRPPEGQVVATDPSQDVVAWIDDDHLVVHDALTGAEVESFPLLSQEGDTGARAGRVIGVSASAIWVTDAEGDTLVQMDRETGRPSPLQGGADQVVSGVALRVEDQRMEVRTVAQNQRLAGHRFSSSFDQPGVAVATLSPDGRYAQAGEFDTDAFFGSFYDLGTGTERSLDTFTMEGPEPACSHSCGWTSTHRVLSVLEDGTVSSCSPRRLQRCDSWRIELPHGAVPSDVVYAAEVTHPRA